MNGFGPAVADASARADDATRAGDLLRLDAVSAGYGPFRALFDVSLGLPAGGALAVLGANGAGKTTLARVVSGLVPPTSGRVLFDGEDIARMRAWQVARLGIAHAPEGRSVFASLTVEENLVLVFREHAGKEAVPAALTEAFELFPRLGERRQQVAGTLSGGEQRMLSLARVLVFPPKLLIVDELSLGLAPIIIDEVYATLLQVKERGTSLLIIEQHIEHALEIADRAAVLRRGEVAFEGPTDQVEALNAELLPGADR